MVHFYIQAVELPLPVMEEQLFLLQIKFGIRYPCAKYG